MTSRTSCIHNIIHYHTPVTVESK